jgi:hypothetical protein
MIDEERYNVWGRSLMNAGKGGFIGSGEYGTYRSVGAEERKEGVERDNVDLGAETEEEKKRFIWYQSKGPGLKKTCDTTTTTTTRNTLYDTHEDTAHNPNHPFSVKQ